MMRLTTLWSGCFRIQFMLDGQASTIREHNTNYAQLEWKGSKHTVRLRNYWAKRNFTIQSVTNRGLKLTRTKSSSSNKMVGWTRPVRKISLRGSVGASFSTKDIWITKIQQLQNSCSICGWKRINKNHQVYLRLCLEKPGDPKDWEPLKFRLGESIPLKYEESIDPLKEA